jgi:hypothetical protein
MATDGPDPDPCEQEIYRKGTIVLQMHSVSSNRMEGWVKKIAKQSGQPVDWHLAAGWATVKALGDLTKVNDAIQENYDDLVRLQEASMVETYRKPGQFL